MKAILAMAGLVLVAAVGAGCVWLWYQAQPKPNSDVTLIQFRAGRLPLADEATQKKLEVAAGNAANHEDKIALWEAAAMSAQFTQHYNDAVRDALEAEKLGTSHASNALALAAMYEEQSDDKNQALKYYRLGVERLKVAQKNKVGRDPAKLIEGTQAKIQELEAQGAK